jgi:hypothetical protein
MSEHRGVKHPVFVVLITSGTVVEYTPELYRSRNTAADEAERWAWLLGAQHQQTVRRPFDDRWEVGDHDIRLVECDATGADPTLEWWVATHWSPDGAPDPEARLIAGREEAREWVRKEPDQLFSDLHETRWMISASFGRADDESYSVAHLAKACERLGAADSLELVEYEIELTGTFVQSIESRVTGPPGLSRTEIEELIDRDWAEISVDTRVLLESSWELDDFKPF